MNIIIVGCGKVGISLAERLSAEGHDLVMVDISAKKVEEISNKYDIMGIVGNGASFAVQQEAGVEKADILADYIATQAYVLEPYRKMLKSNPDFPYFLTKADISYIEEFYDAFSRIYSDPADYLQAMGMDTDQTKALLKKLKNT